MEVLYMICPFSDHRPRSSKWASSPAIAPRDRRHRDHDERQDRHDDRPHGLPHGYLLHWSLPPDSRPHDSCRAPSARLASHQETALIDIGVRCSQTERLSAKYFSAVGPPACVGSRRRPRGDAADARQGRSGGLRVARYLGCAGGIGSFTGGCRPSAGAARETLARKMGPSGLCTMGADEAAVWWSGRIPRRQGAPADGDPRPP